ncbi:tetratricopeptide (TPR) repeat protein [Chryseobacterium sp. SORGH_AS 447]|uniref:helix-turn-helix domain-containing protein n=1 Tax=Chryseobacterium sp. SORGH_AS_0447 TaxID=3041769 RepID=UPI0027834529|nr:helix-turn-helix domain-containing protein [Chryseobacterium sp. SORGH_AS_0447]MDQ1162457.1 tetratricopeptide (TPR) repeat protein [Chryseobacterium sp. SORGH_AS_0447]
MKLLTHHITFLFLFSAVIYIHGQNLKITDNSTFGDIRKYYEDLPENDKQALPYVNVYLKKAKKENDYIEILQGYQDAIYFSRNKFQKLKYADRCVSYILKSKDQKLISKAYLEKGVIYYFFYKQYQPALNEYLKAYEHSENIDDEFLRYRIIYHLGVVKSYLGYYNEALKLFKKCSAYFEPLTKSRIHPNLIFNNRKGYLNSLHQQIICYRHLKNYSKSDSLIRHGLSLLQSSDGFDLEKAYFIKCLGISCFERQKYQKAIQNLDLALPELRKIDDFTGTSLSYYYIGKSYEKMHKDNLAVDFFIKVDSVFQKEKFIIPEVRGNYESLINYYHKVNIPEKELYYTKQLLKADSIINKDFRHLSDKIHKEYDTKSLLGRQKELESKNSIGFIVLMISSALIIILITVLLHRKKKEKEIQHKYTELEKRIIHQNRSPEKTSVLSCSVKENKTGVPNAVINDILEKLNDFEKRKGFIKKGLTQQELAKSFNTNTSYLSQVINESKGRNFNRYINKLRIKYITQELYHNPKYLDYTIEGLTQKCGISSRKSFSDLFHEINGIRPTDFIKQRKKELEEKTNI